MEPLAFSPDRSADDWWMESITRLSDPSNLGPESRAIETAVARLYDALGAPVERLQIVIADGPFEAFAVYTAMKLVCRGSFDQPVVIDTAVDQPTFYNTDRSILDLNPVSLREIAEHVSRSLVPKIARDASSVSGFFLRPHSFPCLNGVDIPPRPTSSDALVCTEEVSRWIEELHSYVIRGHGVTWRVERGTQVIRHYRTINTISSRLNNHLSSTSGAPQNTLTVGDITWLFWIPGGGGWPYPDDNYGVLRRLLDLVSLSHTFYLMRDVAVVCRKPIQLPSITARGFHSGDAGEPIRWGDGTVTYAMHGTALTPVTWKEMTPEYVMESCRGSKKAFRAYFNNFSMANQVLSAAFIERIGYAKFMQMMGAVEIHRDDSGILYRAEMSDDDTVAMLMVEVDNRTANPDGTRTKYYLPVSSFDREGRSIETAKAAVASTYGLLAEEYDPLYAS